MSAFFSLVFLLALALAQGSLLPQVLSGGRVDLVLVAVVCWSLIAGVRAGVLWGLAGGILLDLTSGAPFGIATTMLAALSLVGLLRDVPIFRNSVLLPLVAVVLASVAYHGLFLVVLAAMARPMDWVESLVVLVVPATLADAIALPVLYSFLAWMRRREEPVVDLGW